MQAIDLKITSNELKKTKDAILTNKEVQLFLNKHSSQISNETIEKSLSMLNEFSIQNQSCAKCKGLDMCTNLISGFQPQLTFDGRQIEINYLPCEKKIVAEARRKIQNNIRTLYIPSEIRNANFSKIDVEKDITDRAQAIKKATQFANNYAVGNFVKGLYLHGAYGVGKTFILGAIANQLAEKGIASYIVYWPDFLRELKGSFENNTFNEKIDSLRSVPVLMIDDIGAESMTAWGRDEVMGTILQHRMNEKLPTCFTSNYNFSELEEHLSQGQDTTKAKRIMERIRFLSEPIEVGGQNRRK